VICCQGVLAFCFKRFPTRLTSIDPKSKEMEL
jgi:hypothetical protein